MDWQDTPLDDCDIYVRVLKVLRASDPSGTRFETIGQLAQMSDDKLLAIPGFGAKSLQHVKDVVRSSFEAASGHTA